jgi:secondary thiamine-phosphate synthase enzyme
VRQTFKIDTDAAQQSIDITAKVTATVAESGIDSGFCHVMVLHSSASIIINETADPNIGLDLIDALGRAIPTRSNWLHDRIDDNAHSHIKASILGPSEMIAIDRGELVLGKWQEIMLIEFDGPRERQVSVQLLSS